MTYIELKELLEQQDTDFLIDMLQLSSQEVVEAFSNKIEDMFPQLAELFEPTEQLDVGVFFDQDSTEQQD